MGKISIVQRRRRNKEVQTAALLRARQREEMKQSVHDYLDGVQQDQDVISLGTPQQRDVNESSLDLELSENQVEELNSILDYDDLMRGSTEEANVKIYRNEDNRVVFRFSIQPQQPFQMLTSEDVCNMLKISRRTLYKNVHKKEIPSYKIGSQLRFIAEDIMEYFRKTKHS